MPEVTHLLKLYGEGDKEALAELMPLVYAELREIAGRHLRKEQHALTLQPTALIHEAYMKLVAGRPPQAENRLHFLAIAAQLMRQILVDHARTRGRAKRNPGALVTLDENRDAAIAAGADILDLDDAMHEMAKENPRRVQLMEMHYFGGMTAEESATALAMSVHIVRREIRLGQMWLRRKLVQGEV